MVTSQTQESKAFVFGKIPDDYLVFMPKNEAIRLAYLLDSAHRAKTWGELRSLLPKSVTEEIVELYVNNDVLELDEITDATLFDIETIPGWCDGDWPDWPAQKALDWVPKEIQEEFGEIDASVHNGSFLKLNPEKEADIVKAFEEIGYVIEKNEALVRKAGGYTEVIPCNSEAVI